ncbi:MAG: hypothetical protein PF444_09785, partial [Bacteroidales bacterium]|nr:hypothetical protein [Bacteroidales bacterium]
MTKEERDQLKKLKKLEAIDKKEKEEDRKELKKITDETVRHAFGFLETASKVITNTKRFVYTEFNELIELKKQIYDTSEEQFSHTFTTQDSKLKVIVGFNVVDSFDDSHTAGVDGVLAYLNKLGKDDDSRWLVDNLKKYLARSANG